MSKKIVVFILFLTFFTACKKTQKEKMEIMIADKDCKCWVSEKPRKKSNTILCYKKNGYMFYITGRTPIYGFLANDVVMPSYWELVNDSTFRRKWNKKNYYDSKILKLNKDTFEVLTIVHDTTFLRDTLFSVPDSLKYLIDKYNNGQIIDTIDNVYYVK
jgi:hypothetical protein